MGTRPECCPRCGNRKIEEFQDGKTLFRCPECRSRFGNKEESLDYASRLVKFNLEIRNFSGTNLSLRLCREEGRYSYLVKTGKGKGRDGEVEEGFWKEFSRSLFFDWFFHKWSESYFGTNGPEGLVWDAETSFERKHTISIHGFNSHPVYWNAMIKFLSPVFEECGLKLMLRPTFALEEIE